MYKGKLRYTEAIDCSMTEKDMFLSLWFRPNIGKLACWPNLAQSLFFEAHKLRIVFQIDVI